VIVSEFQDACMYIEGGYSTEVKYKHVRTEH